MHWQTYFMVGSGKNMLPSVRVAPEPLAVRLLLVLLFPSCQRSLYPPATFTTLCQKPGHMLYSHSPRDRQKVVNPVSEMSVLSGNVKIWMVSLSWVSACVCGIRAIFLLLSIVLQSSGSLWVLLYSGITQWWQSSEVFHNLSCIGHAFYAVTSYSLPCLLW